MSDETLVLHGARIIDGTGAEPVRGRAVVVEGGTITAVVDEARAPRGRGIDLAGHTLLPGLINCHVHLCFGAEADPVAGLDILFARSDVHPTHEVAVALHH